MNSTATLNGQELELFRVGNYGDKGVYSAADLEDLVARYKGSDEAPITAGHPEKDDEPAFGWFKSLRTDGTLLFGTAGEVNPDFDKAVRQGSFKHRSVGFTRDKDGKLHLRHVAFLGAVPPAIKGLKPAHFSSEPYQEIAFSESEGDVMTTDQQQQETKKTVLETMREFFSAKDTTTAPVDTKALEERVAASLEAKFADQLKAERDAREKVEKDFADHKKAFSATDAKARVDATISALKSKGAWVPAYDKIGVPALFAALAGQAEVIKFSDGAKDVERDGITLFADILGAVGQIVPKDKLFSAAAATEQSKAAPVANGADVDPASVTFSELVTKYAEENKVPYTEAYRKLSAEGKRPQSGAAAAGAV